jgi:transcriptional regulator with XRE-family HTH domain
VKAQAIDRIVNVIGPQVRRLRWKEAWTQGRLAEKLQDEGWNVGRARIAKIEAGITWITEMECMFLAKVFRVTVLELLPKLNGQPIYPVMSRIVGKRVKLLVSPEDILTAKSAKLLDERKFCPRLRTKFHTQKRIVRHDRF